MKALGIEGDTPRDTVASLVAQVRKLRGELQATVSDNRAQREENQRLRQREASIDKRINAALDAERERLRQEQQQASSQRRQTEGLLAELQRRLDGLKREEHKDLPVGLGLEQDSEALRWIEPEDAVKKGRNGKTGYPGRFGLGSEAPPPSPSQPVPADPAYTVPANATLIGSVAMSALIGRVPVDGTVNDPYPFKVVVGQDNLTANGVDLPDVAGAVVSGTATGDWTLSCVRGKVRSITFVFNDGTIRTVPAKGKQQQGGDSDEGLGWISDPHGVPCVSGERRSNAQQYLGSQSLITAAGAGVAALLDKGSEISLGAGSSIGTMGIFGQEAIGRILANGVQDLSKWVNKLYGEAYAAVYVAPGAEVAIHIEQPIEIDYEPAGRMVDHSAGETQHETLD